MRFSFWETSSPDPIWTTLTGPLQLAKPAYAPGVGSGRLSANLLICTKGPSIAKTLDYPSALTIGIIDFSQQCNQ